MNINKRLRIPWFYLLILTTSIIIGTLRNVNQSTAQSSNVIDWSNEEIIKQVTMQNPQSFFPVIAADNYGTVHIFWTEGEGIYYAYKKDQVWSQPTDIVWGDQKEFTYPAVVIDHNQILHLFWVAWGEIYHKYVPAQDAADIRAWSGDQLVLQFGGTGTPIRAAVDSQNRIDLVFSDWNGKTGQTAQGNVHLIVSTDQGLTWSDPVKISDVPIGELTTDPRIAIDDQDKVHIVWGQMAPSLNGRQQGVFYSRLSRDDQIEISQNEIESYETEPTWLTNINIVAPGNNQVILVWVCGTDNAHRCYTWSDDGGDHWKDIQQVFTDLIGLSGWDAIVQDGANQLFWLTVLRYPQALYSSLWDGTAWQDPPDIASTDTIMKLGENINATSNLGNQVHVVVQLGSYIVYMKGITNAAEKPAEIPPTYIPEITITENITSSELPTVITTPTPIQTPTNHNNPIVNINPASQLTALLFGIVAVLILLVIFGFYRLYRR